VDQILRDEPEQVLKIHFGGVNRENLVEPETRTGQVPKPQSDKSETNQGKNYQPDFIAKFHSIRFFNFFLKRDPVAEPAVDARVKKRDFLERIGIAAVGKTFVERFRIDMQADGAAPEFGQIENLVNRLFEFDFRCQTIGKVELVGFDELAVTFRFVDLDGAKILPAQFADRNRHPAPLFGMIVNARNLPAFPADRHQLEPRVLVDQIARVTAFAPEKIRRDRIDVDLIFAQKPVNIVAGKIGVRDAAKTFY
jgi:hypothetical protein